MTLTALLVEAREHAGLTQAELAGRAGTAQSAISAYESGATVPSLRTLERLLAACGRRLELRTSARIPTSMDGPVGRRLHRHLREVRALLEDHGATDPRVFGSVARGDDTENSDIDMVLTMPEGATLLDLAAITRALTQTIGVEVDVTTDGALEGDAAFARAVLAEAVPL